VQTLTLNEFTNITRIARLLGSDHGFDVAFAVALTCLRKRDPYLWAASLELPGEIVDLFKHAFDGRLPDRSGSESIMTDLILTLDIYYRYADVKQMVYLMRGLQNAVIEPTLEARLVQLKAANESMSGGKDELPDGWLGDRVLEIRRRIVETEGSIRAKAEGMGDLGDRSRFSFLMLERTCLGFCVCILMRLMRLHYGSDDTNHIFGTGFYALLALSVTLWSSECCEVELYEMRSGKGRRRYPLQTLTKRSCRDGGPLERSQ